MAMDLLKLTGRSMAENTGVKIPDEKKPPGDELVGNFQDIFGEKINELVDITQHSAKMKRDFAAGVEGVDIHDVTIASAQAGLAVESAIQIRNLALRAYQTFSNLR